MSDLNLTVARILSGVVLFVGGYLIGVHDEWLAPRLDESQTIHVGRIEDHSCHLEVTLGVLPDLIAIGVLDWVERCEDDQ